MLSRRISIRKAISGLTRDIGEVLLRSDADAERAARIPYASMAPRTWR